MDLVQIDEQGRLYLSPDIDDWEPVHAAGIDTIIDLDGGVDIGVPAMANHLIYLYFPFEDAAVPTMPKLHAVARFGANCVRDGHRVLSHCGLGFNRSALVAGLILRYLGMSGEEAVQLLRLRRPGALYNQVYADYLLSCEVRC